MLDTTDDRADKQREHFDTLWDEIRELQIENLRLRLQLRKLQGGDGVPRQHQAAVNVSAGPPAVALAQAGASV